MFTIRGVSSRKIVRGAFLLLAAAFFANAQTDLSTVRGTVTDSSGAAAGGVEVRLNDQSTNFVRTVQTDASGNFEIPYLRRGSYRLTVTAPGFTTFVADNLILESSQTRRVDVSLTVGQVTSEVTVAADAAVIEVESSAL